MFIVAVPLTVILGIAAVYFTYDTAKERNEGNTGWSSYSKGYILIVLAWILGLYQAVMSAISLEIISAAIAVSVPFILSLIVAVIILGDFTQEYTEETVAVAGGVADAVESMQPEGNEREIRKNKEKIRKAKRSGNVTWEMTCPSCGLPWADDSKNFEQIGYNVLGRNSYQSLNLADDVQVQCDSCSEIHKVEQS